MRAAERFIDEYQVEPDTGKEVLVTEEDFLETAKNVKPSVSVR